MKGDIQRFINRKKEELLDKGDCYIDELGRFRKKESIAAKPDIIEIEYIQFLIDNYCNTNDKQMPFSVFNQLFFYHFKNSVNIIDYVYDNGEVSTIPFSQETMEEFYNDYLKEMEDWNE